MDSEEKLAYQIIDANLNRIREGMRCVEETIRYNPQLSEHYEGFRNIRHQFSNLENELREFLPALLQSRNMLTDSGVAAPATTHRTSLKDLLLANTKRVAEGLRVVEEYLKLLNNTSFFTEKIKTIRYQWYNIEQLLASSWNE